MLYDIIIIGAGPAGSSAAVYSARKQLKTLLVADSFGGQSIVSDDIQNWIGEQHISGVDLAKKFEDHVRSFENFVDIRVSEKVVSVRSIKCEEKDRKCDFEVITDKENKFQGKSIILASGARRRRLGVPGEDIFDGKGVAYCSTCDAPLFSGRDIAVVGGGNAGVEAVIDLIPYANKIYLLQRGNKLKADKVNQNKILMNGKVEIIFNAEITKIAGDKFVSSINYRDSKGNSEKQLEVGGVFVEIGSVPNSEMVKGLVKLDRFGQVKIDSKFSTTSHPGIFAAGDITDDPYKQNNISAGDGVKAALSAYNYILDLDKKSPCEEAKDCI